MASWKFAKAIHENEEFMIDGMNIWNHYWQCVDKKVQVIGPERGNMYNFKEYQIEHDGKTINFVAGELMDSKVGIYIKDDLSEGKF